MLVRALFCATAFLLTFTAAFAADKSIDLRVNEPSATAAAPRRLALVVGNSAYRFSGVLANPASDAELMAKTLKEVGFQLHGGGAQVNLTRAALDQAIESFGDSLRPGDVALFYYSGHGLQVNGENYLVPVDADIKKEAEVRVKTVPVNLLFAKLEGAGDVVNIVILDACRNNPFARSFRSSGGGLAAVNAPTGTIVAFSTGPGQVAEDGAGKNSTYTAALAQYVREPGLRVEDVFKKVRTSVSSLTKGSQTPWENTSLTGDFSFIEGDALALKKAALAAGGKEKAAELAALQRMEAEAAQLKEKEQAEIAKHEDELAQLDEQIAEMKNRLGTPAATGSDNLQNMLAMVRQREEPAKKLETLRQKREIEERERQAEIESIKAEARAQRSALVDEDIKAYEEIVNSFYGREMSDAAWQSLVRKYPRAAEVDKGDLLLLRQVVVEETTVESMRLRNIVGDFVRVPGGCYLMGDNFSDGQGDAKPVHEVCIDAFSIGKTEVTQAQWRQVMGSNPSHFSGCDSCPVESVSWDDVQEYLLKLNMQTGEHFRLPTEAEWEYAARSGGKQEKYAGSDSIDAVAWYSGNGVKKTHHVAQKQPNGLGLYDMSGNVSEWVQDWYGSDTYSMSPRKNPKGPPAGSGRVDRGGSWGASAFSARVYFRYDRVTGGRSSVLGFRLALSPSQ